MTWHNSMMSLWSNWIPIVVDAQYKGADTNLINGETLTVSFEGNHFLEIEGFSAQSADLGGDISESTNDWAAKLLDITTDIGKLDTALSTLRNESKALASNLAVINTRQDFHDEYDQRL